MDYFTWAAGPQTPNWIAVGRDDPMAASIRVALDARKLGWSQERTEAAMLRAGFGIDVQEQAR